MKQYNRVCARINLDAIAYNMEQMKNRIGQEGRLIAVIKTDAYGHGAVPLAEMFEETPYIWGYAVACMGEARTLRAHGIKKPILILGCVFLMSMKKWLKKKSVQQFIQKRWPREWLMLPQGQERPHFFT